MSQTELKIGAVAPSFTLLDQDERKVSLKGYAGRWLVLYFYPKDDTPGCTVEACEFTSALKDFEKVQAAVAGVSPDAPQSHRKFADKHGLKLRLLSDTDHAVLKAYVAWGLKSMYGKKYEGVLRSTVLIDPKGRIAFHWPKVKPEGHAKEVREKLAELGGS
jgi:peroxiredoxin Q/BCP